MMSSSSCRVGGVVDFLDGRSPRTVLATSTSSSLSPSFKQRDDSSSNPTTFPLPSKSTTRRSKSIPLLPDITHRRHDDDIENNVNDNINPATTTDVHDDRSIELLKMMKVTNKKNGGGASLMSCSYNTMQKHYDNDTLRMLQRITNGRQRGGGGGTAAAAAAGPGSSRFNDVVDDDQYQEEHEVIGIGNTTTSTSTTDHHDVESDDDDDDDDDGIFEMDL